VKVKKESPASESTAFILHRNKLIILLKTAG